MLTKHDQSAFKSKHGGAGVTTQPNMCGDEDAGDAERWRNKSVKEMP